MKNKIKEILTKELNLNEIYSRKQIVDILKANGISESKIPNITSMTYNQWNKGMSNFHLNPLFEYVGRNQYRFLGVNFPYCGDLFNFNKSQKTLIKIGYWINGVLYDYNNQLENYQFDIDLLILEQENKDNNISVSSELKSNALSELLEMGFVESGYYFLQNEKVNVTKINKDRASLVYAFIVNHTVYYVGKTVQGFIRPFGYHKNEVMIKVKYGIEQFVFNNCNVSIYTLLIKDEDFLLWKGLKLNIVEAVEQALITKFSPEWNKYKHK
ncbi:MAG: hypothetical protein ACK448_11315 [Bacteroidota bacterium]